MDINEIWKQIDAYISLYGLKLIGAIIALILGLWIIAAITRAVGKGLKKSKTDPSLHSFIKSFVSVGLKTLLIISVMTMVGIQMTGFIAILGAAGLAVGLALSGALQNFAGGVMLLTFKPFKNGDYVSVLGESGTVTEIQIFNTILLTPDNKTIIIPNGKIYTEPLTNFSRQERRRVDLTFGISYTDDVKKAREIILSVIATNEKVITDPAPFVGLIELGDSSVNLVTRVWAKTSDYWAVYFYLNEEVFNTFKKQGISIPFPQMDVHISKE